MGRLAIRKGKFVLVKDKPKKEKIIEKKIIVREIIREESVKRDHYLENSLLYQCLDCKTIYSERIKVCEKCGSVKILKFISYNH
ncbi:MAG: hypothetical protein ACTSUX_08830 [Promethearchaeota archaeon]